jgi:hypothetical protein
MQVAYGLETDAADQLARLLAGRPLLIVATAEWSEFLFELLAICRALAERGATGRVLFDRPIDALADDVAAGRRWVPPLYGLASRPREWNEDVLGRIRALDFEQFIWPGDWPATAGDAVVFRFGYFDNFAPEAARTMANWQAGGATFLNPPITYLESKAVLAAAWLPVVLDRLAAIDPAHPDTLARGLPETHLLRPEIFPLLRDERREWLIKYAGFDGDNQAWGGRSVQFGHDHSAASWAAALRGAAELPWPVVAQRLIPSARLDVEYFDGDTVRTLAQGHTRLRVFLLRQPEGAHAVGAHLTISAATPVADSIVAVQTPVQFRTDTVSTNDTNHADAALS